MTATTPGDTLRLAIEDAIACLLSADEHQRMALMRMVQRARTDEEASIIGEQISARREIRKARDLLLGLHPNCRKP